MRIRFYLDEDVPFSFSQALLNRGVDVLTTQEANNCGKTDLEQLKFAAKESRVMLTHNKRDFIELYTKFIKDEISHAGIIITGL
jgi:predicted nuclease of predicted toxin-antitoxin system